MRFRTIALAIAILAGNLGSLDAVDEGAGPAARFVVSITEFRFTPKNIQVRVGDMIVWKNNGTMVHTTTANGGLWNSGNMAPEARFAFTFNSTGTFPYRCGLHPVQMQGTVRVVP
jgi:plastocyanin